MSIKGSIRSEEDSQACCCSFISAQEFIQQMTKSLTAGPAKLLEYMSAVAAGAGLMGTELCGMQTGSGCLVITPEGLPELFACRQCKAQIKRSSSAGTMMGSTAHFHQAESSAYSHISSERGERRDPFLSAAYARLVIQKNVVRPMSRFDRLHQQTKSSSLQACASRHLRQARIPHKTVCCSQEKASQFIAAVYNSQ